MVIALDWIAGVRRFSDEFRPYRDQLRADLTRHNVEVKVQDEI